MLNHQLLVYLNITISDVPVVFSYAADNYNLTRAEPMVTPISPVSNGIVETWEIEPELTGTGLSFDSATGEISGTPIINKTRTQYTVWANNTGGNVSQNFNITINEPRVGLDYSRENEIFVTGFNISLKKYSKIKNPRIAITGLNPHAGEGGEFGKEEQNIISPVISSMIKKGLNLEGPLPADTAFTPDKIKETDCFLTMFHDQGLAPFKALSFGKGVNITLGLPFIRTSVDHGTAFDIVGTKKINTSSFYEALDIAIQLSQ